MCYILSRIACELLEEGVAAIFGPASPHTRGIVASIAARYEIPHIEYVWRERERVQAETEENKISSMTINVYPDSEMISQVSLVIKKIYFIKKRSCVDAL